MSIEFDPRHITEATAQALHDNRMGYDLYTGRSTSLNNHLFWEKKSGGNYLMKRSYLPLSLDPNNKVTAVSASLMSLGYVSRQSCFTSPRWMISTEFGANSRKHSLRLVSARGFQAFEKSFSNTYQTLEKLQNFNPEWKNAKKAHLLEGDGADNGGAIILKLAAYRTPSATDPFDEGDWPMIKAWSGDESVKNEIRKIMETGHVPQLLEVYDNETKKRLTADEIEAKLPGALVEVVFSIKHNYLRQGKSHSFSATIQQIIILQTLEDEPAPSIFDDHDASMPLILSPGKKRVHDDMVTAEEYEDAEYQASPSKRSKKATTKPKSPPKQAGRPTTRRGGRQNNNVKAGASAKGKQKALVVDTDDESDDTGDTVKSE